MVDPGGLGPTLVEGERSGTKSSGPPLWKRTQQVRNAWKKHLEALEKARDKCAKKLAEVRQQKAEQEALEKAKEEAEETSAWESAKGKKKQRSKRNKAFPYH